MNYSKNDQIKPVKKHPKPKTERKKIEDALDKLVSKIVRLTDRKCIICGRSEGVLNAHHFKSRRYFGVRWYIPNLICLCVHHHTFDFKFSAHKTPEAFKARMIELKGQKWEEDIERRAREHTSWSMDDLRAMKETFSEVLKVL